MNICSRFHAAHTGLVALGCFATVFVAQAAAQGAGVTARDEFPNGCISCHTATSKDGDTRLSTYMKKWTVGVDLRLVTRAKASAIDPEKIKGKHPSASNPGANVPQSCLNACHKKGSTIAPPFASLIHNVHLTGAQNRFVTLYKGDCTHCHKLDQKTGAWKMPSGAEK